MATIEVDLGEFDFWGYKTFVAQSILAQIRDLKDCFVAQTFKTFFSWGLSFLGQDNPFENLVGFGLICFH